MAQDSTPNLVLPYLMAAQAQKHVTHNEALRALDAIIQIGVKDRNLMAPPASPSDGDRYIVASGATGAWSGAVDKIAAHQDGAWMLYQPREGWLAWIDDEDLLVVWDGTAWITTAGGGGSVNPTPLVGVNATADTTNRLAVSSAASLFNHAGSGHQVKINKAAATDTASVLFQTAFSGRAEFGLTGDDNWHVKVSPNGSTWSNAIIVDRTTGNVGIGDAPAAKLHTKVTSGSVSARVETTAVDTSSTYSAFEMKHGSGVNATFTTGYGYFYFGTTSNHRSAWITNNAERATLTATGVLHPASDNAQSLGQSSNRWSSVWAANGTIQTSDARDKIRVGDLETVAGRLVDRVRPHLFRWIVGSNEVEVVPAVEAGRLATIVERPKPGRRLHAGFFAQDLKAAMDAEGIDFGAWGLSDKNDADSRQWVRPDQLIPVLWQALKETRDRLAALESGRSPKR